jgi:hypothetical protein
MSYSGYRQDGSSGGFAHVQFEKLDDAIAAYESAMEEPIFLMGRTIRLDYAGTKIAAAEPHNKLYFVDFRGNEEDLRKATREFESSIISFYLREL